MLDIGCGFPPYTTLDTANYLPDWTITGADPSLPIYLIYDEAGNYATLDEHKSTVYFQPALPTLENWNQLLANSTATKLRFERLLEQLLTNTGSAKPGSFPRLEYDPIKLYETDRLSFIKGGIGQVAVGPKDVIRCFNVLYYFNNAFMERALQWFADHTKEGGIVLIGGDWAASTECYYHTYKKEGNQLLNKEFAFSLDCICPFGIVTWYTSHNDDQQKAELVRHIGTIRKDKAFMDAFYSFHDAQRARYRVCARDEKGYYGEVDPAMAPQELWTNVDTILHELNEAGLNQKAADVLVKAGLKARVNEVGHIAIAP
jgi:hypothetical protein